MEAGKAWKIAGYTGAAVLVLIGAALVYLTGFKLKTKTPPLTVEITPARVEAGRYLANHVMVCIDCHSTRNWELFSGPLVPGTEGSGGEVFSEEMGFPGKFVAHNITPYGLKGLDDATLFRAITQGIDRRDMPLFPVMPYLHYGTLDREDIYSLIAYLRTLPEIEFTPEASYANFPFSIIMYMIPKKPVFVNKPSKADTPEYGEYVVKAAGCIDCHTLERKGKIYMDKAFAGGREFRMPMKTVVSANITPSVSTGIGNWTPEAFVARFKAYDPATGPLPKASSVGFNTPMPWSMYAGMDTIDLLAMHTYLRSLKPIENAVIKLR